MRLGEEIDSSILLRCAWGSAYLPTSSTFNNMPMPAIDYSAFGFYADRHIKTDHKMIASPRSSNQQPDNARTKDR